MNSKIKELYKKHRETPSEKMTSEDTRHMNGNVLLKIKYFLNKDHHFDNLFEFSILLAIFCNFYLLQPKLILLNFLEDLHKYHRLYNHLTVFVSGKRFVKGVFL